MRTFDEIYDIAAERKGSAEALETLLDTPLSDDELSAIPNDRWLSAMAKCLFQAGFNWKVIEAKWHGIEEAFDEFDPVRVAFYDDEDFDRLLSDKRIVRNGAKVEAVINNARFILALEKTSPSVGAFFAGWESTRYIELLDLLSKQGARLGALTGQRMLRMNGKDSFLLSPDVVARLVAEGIVDKASTSKRAMVATQGAFNIWADQSGRGLTQISQVLAFSV